MPEELLTRKQMAEKYGLQKLIEGIYMGALLYPSGRGRPMNRTAPGLFMYDVALQKADAHVENMLKEIELENVGDYENIELKNEIAAIRAQRGKAND